MKQVARLGPTLDSGLITIWELRRRRKQDPETWDAHPLYALGGGQELIARYPQRAKWHFAFKAKDEQERPGSSDAEGLVHELAKDVLIEKKQLNLPIFGRKVDVVLSELQSEWGFEGPHGKRFIDIVGTIVGPEAQRAEWNGRLGIELCVTNKVNGVKQADLRTLDFAVVEVVIWEKLVQKAAAPENLTEADLLTLRKSLKTWFTNENPKIVTVLHNPNWRAYWKPEQKRTAPEVPLPVRILAQAENPRSWAAGPSPVQPVRVAAVQPSFDTLDRVRSAPLNGWERNFSKVWKQVQRLARWILGRREM